MQTLLCSSETRAEARTGVDLPGKHLFVNVLLTFPTPDPRPDKALPNTMAQSAEQQITRARQSGRDSL